MVIDDDFTPAKLVARCEKCGREFVSLPSAEQVDVYQPLWTLVVKLRMDDPDPPICGGRIVPITKLD